MRSGDRRRQSLLNEQNVADLYGEETLRDIVWQSEPCPLPIPLAFGCGYVRKGEWAPASHSVERYVDRPLGIQRALVEPFAGYENLQVLREAMETARIQRELQQRGIAPIAGGGFSSLSDLISEATVGGKRQEYMLYKTTNPTTVAGAAYWEWMWAGAPAAGTIPAASVASTSITNATTGAVTTTNAAGGDTLHAVSAAGMSTVAAGAELWVDLTLLVQPVLATTTSQTITGSPARYQSNGNNGVMIINFKGGSADANAAPNITVTYTESTAGTTGHTTGAQTGNATNPAYRTELSNGQMFFPLAAGDVGVRRIETTTWSVARSTATTFGLCLPLFWLPFGVANTLFGTDLINTQFNLPQITDNAALTAILMAATTTSGNLTRQLVLVSG